MKLTQITDFNIPQLQIYKTLRDNVITKDNSFIADSPKVVNTLLQTDIEFKSILATKEYYDEFKYLINKKEIKTLYVADRELMATIVGHKIHHNVMAHGIRPKPYSLNDLGEQIIMLDELSSTQNVGSIARCGAAIGIGSYLLPKAAPHPYARKALRVSMGHISKLKYSLYEDIITALKQLKKNGYKIYGAEVTPNSTPLSKLQPASKWVLLMGSEGYGLSQEVIKMCDEIITIEMAQGVRSFNVGVASSLIMYKLQHG